MGISINCWTCIAIHHITQLLWASHSIAVDVLQTDIMQTNIIMDITCKAIFFFLKRQLLSQTYHAMACLILIVPNGLPISEPSKSCTYEPPLFMCFLTFKGGSSTFNGWTYFSGTWTYLTSWVKGGKSTEFLRIGMFFLLTLWSQSPCLQVCQ